MEETKEQLFARLETLGFEKVNEMRNRGVLTGNPIWAHEWLQERGIRRLEEAQALHRRAVYAAERSASSSEKAARFAMLASLIALVTVAVAVIPSCVERL